MNPTMQDIEAENYKHKVSLQAKTAAKEFMVYLKDYQQQVKELYATESSATTYYFGKLFSEYVAMYAAHYVDISDDKPQALKEVIHRFVTATTNIENNTFGYAINCLENSLIKHVPEMTTRNFQCVSLNVDIKHALLNEMKTEVTCPERQKIIQEKLVELHNNLIKKLGTPLKTIKIS